MTAPDGSPTIASPVRRLSLAVMFLTAVRLPGGGAAAEPDDLWGSMAWYPLVGLGLGAAAWGVYALLLYAVTPLVAAALVVVALELATRALHSTDSWTPPTASSAARPASARSRS